MLSLLPLTLGFSPGLVPRTSGVEQRAAVPVQMAAKRIALGVVAIVATRRWPVTIIYGLIGHPVPPK